VAELRGMAPEALAHATTENACKALPRLGALLV
jgi:Tat protein secretion system quality control protein TatD with DNase activity